MSLKYNDKSFYSHNILVFFVSCYIFIAVITVLYDVLSADDTDKDLFIVDHRDKVLIHGRYFVAAFGQ